MLRNVHYKKQAEIKDDLPEVIQEENIEENIIEEIVEEMPEEIAIEESEVKTTLRKYIEEGLNNNKLEHRNAILRFQAENNIVADGSFGLFQKMFLKMKKKPMISFHNKEKEWLIVINKAIEH